MTFSCPVWGTCSLGNSVVLSAQGTKRLHHYLEKWVSKTILKVILKTTRGRCVADTTYFCQSYSNFVSLNFIIPCYIIIPKLLRKLKFSIKLFLHLVINTAQFILQYTLKGIHLSLFLCVFFLSLKGHLVCWQCNSQYYCKFTTVSFFFCVPATTNTCLRIYIHMHTSAWAISISPFF